MADLSVPGDELLPLLLDNIQDYALFLTDRQSIVVKWTPGIQRLFGYTEDELVGQNGDILFTPEDRAANVPHQERTRALKHGRADDIRWHQRKDGSRLWCNGQLIALYDEQKRVRGFAKLMRDETQRKKNEEALRASGELLLLTVEAAKVGTCDWHYSEGLMYGNVQRFRLYGLEPQSGPLTTQQFRETLHPDERDHVWFSMTRQIERHGEHQQEYRVVWPDGTVHWIAEAGRVVEWENSEKKQGPRQVVSILWDVTTRREAEEVLRQAHDELENHVQQRTRELTQALEQVQAEVRQRRELEAARAELVKRIVNTQEEERGRISRELHDNLGQYLTAVMLGLQALELEIKGSAGKSDIPHLEKLRSLVDELMKAAHRQAWELRPAELDAMGLNIALAHYIGDWSQRAGVQVDYQSVGWDDQRVEKEVETTLYRVVQEALTNVARHANATGVSVVLELSPSTASAIVEDNGSGFDPEHSTRRLGVVGMQERLTIVGGTLDIESAPGAGTTVFARVPLRVQPSISEFD